MLTIEAAGGQAGGTAGYDAYSVEVKWRARWAESALYRTPDAGDARPKFYCLDFFPYPSGDGLSVGHGRNYLPSDVISRYHRMRGDAVLHPMGWDAFGQPAENEAIRRGIHPRETTTRYAATYRRQMTSMGLSYDWEREINSSAPEFYRWTQWFFLLLFRRGLAYRAAGRQWWCPGCRTVLANEQVDAHGVCWRGHPGVFKRDLEQWYFRITAYADELLAGLDELDWPEHILAMQRHWIGRSEGVEFDMVVPGEAPAGRGAQERFRVYTTRPDTICGMTFAVVAPEHPLLERITTAAQRADVIAYRDAAARRSEVDRLTGGRARSGVFTGAHAVNPVNGERVPVYVADYVLASHGDGAIMGVPAHDARDFDFARRFGIPVRQVVAPPGWTGETLPEAYTGPGLLVNSGGWDGMPSDEAAERIAGWLVAEGRGQRAVHYRMRDWLISRQRYWGAPIPVVYCERCAGNGRSGIVPVPEADLPVLLPPIDEWRPGDDGRSPLANVPAFVATTCPACGGPARRETDTLDGFACSSWYFLRFVSPHYAGGPFDPQALARWGQPDLYVGGAEHAVMHLLYARFWTKVMADAGLLPFREPFPRLRSQGMLHARDPRSGETAKMSKSAHNVVTPDSMAERYGADALRLYLLFMAPFENKTVWEEEGITGARRFLDRAWRLVEEVAAASDQVSAQGAGGDPDPAGPLARATHGAVRRVTSEIEALQFNTAVAGLMEHLNLLAADRQAHGVTPDLAAAVRSFVLLVAPFAPHIAEELWARLGGAYSVHQRPWPTWDPVLAAEEQVTLVIQVNGRVRDRLPLPVGAGEQEAYARALASAVVARVLAGRRPTRVVYVPDRLLNLVVE